MMKPLQQGMRRRGADNPGNRDIVAAGRVQMRVISALMIREALSRYGHENLGFFWIMGEPLLLTVGVMAMWTMAGAGHGKGVGLIPFALTGYSMLTLWRHNVQKSVHALRQNIGLLFHRNIRFLDVLVARATLECLGGLAAFFVAYVPLTQLEVFEPMADPLLLFGAWFFMSWYSFGFGLILAGLTEIYEALERFVPPLMYITLPITGAFYMVTWLPETAQKLVTWSALVHIFEMFRAGLFGSKVVATFDVGYIVINCLLVTAIGLPLVRKAQNHVKIL